MSYTLTPDLRSLLHTIKVHMKLSLARPMFQFIIFLMPFLFSTIAILVYGNSSAEQIFQYVVLGSGFITLWSSIVFSSASDVNREKYYGTLELLFTAPTPFGLTLAGKIIANTLWGIVSMLISYFYLIVIYRVPVIIGHPLQFILAYLFVLCALSVFLLSGHVFYAVPSGLCPDEHAGISGVSHMRFYVSGLRTSRLGQAFILGAAPYLGH